MLSRRRTAGLDQATELIAALARVRIRALSARRGIEWVAGLLAVPGVLLLFSLPLAGVVLAVASLEGEPRERLLNVAAIGLMATWLLPQAVFRVPLNWQLDLRPLARLPIGFGTLWRVKVAASFLGYWVLLFAPMLSALLAGSAASAADALGRAVMVAVFVLVMGRITSLAAPVIDRLVGGALGVVLLVLAVIGAGLALTVLGDGLLADDADASRGSALIRLTWLRFADLLPTGLILELLVEEQPGWLPPGLLVAYLMPLSWLDRRIQRRLCFGQRTKQREKRDRNFWAGLIRSAFAAPGWSVLVAAEAAVVWRTSLFRVALFGMLGYAIFQGGVVGLSGPPVSFMLFGGPFLVLIGPKANLLGWSGLAWREYLLLPVHPRVALVSRSRALDLSSTAVALCAAVIVVLRPGLTGPEWLLTASFLAALLPATSVGSIYFDVRSPRRIDYGRAFPPGGNQLGPLMAVVVFFGLAASYSILIWEKEPLPWSVAAISLTGPLVTWTVWLIFVGWLDRALAGGRERILRNLET